MSATRLPLDLSKPRDLSALIAATLDLQQRWFAVFFSVTALVYVPYELAVFAIWGHPPGETGKSSHAPFGASVALIVAASAVLPALVTALHVKIVQQLADGKEPRVGGAFRLILPAVVPALAAVLLYTVGVFVGFF